MTEYTDIYSFITGKESSMSNDITVMDGWDWNFRNHVRQAVLYKNSQFTKDNDKEAKPFKNIIKPILNLQYRAVGFDLKDIVIFVNDAVNYYKSFLVKKFHEKWARENDIDTFIDEMVEAYTDFGGVLVRKGNKTRPEVVPFPSIAFCDQTDFLSGAFAIKHYFTPVKLREMSLQGWNKDEIEKLIQMSKPRKQQDKQDAYNKITGYYIEVYEVHGTLPINFLEDTDKEDYTEQVHICSFYKTEDKKVGVTLFSGPEGDEFKFLKRDPVFGRCLGVGGVEEQWDPQVWTNFSEGHKMLMLEAASKTIFKTTDAAFANRNKMRDMDNLEIAVLEEGKDITQLDTYPRNMALFDKTVNEWELHARGIGSAFEAIQGQSPTSGTPFKLQELVVNQAQGLHEYRKGKISVFLAEIYKDWVIPYLGKQINKQQEFMAELDPEEMHYVAENLVTSLTNEYIKEKILSGELVDPAEVETQKTMILQDFSKGNKKFITILEKEFKGLELDIELNIAGKQKYLAETVDKLVNIFRQIMAAPQILNDPRMVKIFNQILEMSGLSPMAFSAPIQQQQPVPTAQPLQELASKQLATV